MKFINFLVIGGMVLFFLISIAFFVKRYLDNKDKISNINKENTSVLQRDLEDELRAKKEKELKKLESGDLNTINEVIERLFKSSKLAALIKSKNYKLYDTKKISIIATLSEKDELIESKKEIVLKTGEVYTQNKHFVAIKKEYSDKVFMSAYKIVEEIFNSIPTIYKIYMNLNLPEDNDKQICVLSFEVNRDQFRAAQKINKDFKNKIDTFNAVYDYDSKNYQFSEVQPVNISSNEMTFEKTMNIKASTDTTFYGGTVINQGQSISLKNDVDNNPALLNSDTKISNLGSGSIMFDKSQLGIDKLDKNPDLGIENNDTSFESLIIKFFKSYGLVNVNEEDISSEFKIIKAVRSSDKTPFLVGVNKENKVIKEDDLKSLFFKAIKDNIEKSIFITNSSFALDAVTYANVNNIEIFDQEKINKLNK